MKKGWVVIGGILVRRGSAAWKWAKNHLLPHKPRPSYVVMYDSVTPANIPADAKAVLGYVGGKWPTYQDGSLAKRFPHALKLGIAVAASLDAKALDIERFDATPDQASLWVKRQHKRGEKRPILYVAASGYEALVELLARSGLKLGKDYYVVTAHYTYKQHICGPKSCGFGKRPAHGTQWTDKAPGVNGSLVDESLVQRRILNY